MVHQYYQSRVIDEFVLKGNTGTLKCLIPSFVADFVQVTEWVSDDGSTFSVLMSNDVSNYGKCLFNHFLILAMKGLRLNDSALLF